MKNITPRKLRCAWGSCPAVYELDTDTIAVIGANNHDVAANLRGKIAPHEGLVVISKAFFAEMQHSQSQQSHEASESVTNASD